MINVIAAYNKNRVIGNEGKIPWHLPEDLKSFKEITKGHPVIMGRKTHESIGRLLPGRRNIIVTRQKDYVPVDVRDIVFVMPSLDLAIEAAQREDEEVFVIGGEEIYRQAIPLSDRMYLTHVFSDNSDGDRFFPLFHNHEWTETYCTEQTEFVLTVLERVK